MDEAKKLKSCLDLRNNSLVKLSRVVAVWNLVEVYANWANQFQKLNIPKRLLSDRNAKSQSKYRIEIKT